jgi:hypothetical protein
MLRGRGGSERGSVAITVTLALTVLLGFAALVVDIGLNWAARTSAQTAADSAALGGASQLLTDGGTAAITTVGTLLNQNVDDLVNLSDLAWATDGAEANGEVVCWLLTDPQPGPGAGCPDGANALQVITPPIEVRYAFAPLLGQRSNSIKATAAAGAGPAAPNNCVLCLLDAGGANRLAAIGPGGIQVNGGGIVVNSDSALALVAGLGDIRAEQIRVVGGFDTSTLGGQYVPLPEPGGPPAPDPLEGLPPPPQLPFPPVLRNPGAQVIATDQTLEPGIYGSITVEGTATLTLNEGVYVFRGVGTSSTGLTVQDAATVVSAGDGVTIYLACTGYPAPCSGAGTRFRLEDNGQFQAEPPTTGEYAGLSIFADPGNTRSTILDSDQDLTLEGALYAASSRLRIEDSGGLSVDSLLVVGSLFQLLGSSGPVEVTYDPNQLLPGIGRPVLIR